MRWIIFFLFVVLVETYAYQAVKTLVKTRWILLAYQIVSLLVIIFIVYNFTQFDRSVGQTQISLLTFGLLLLIFLPKLFITLFLLIEDIFRVFAGISKKITGKSKGNFLPQRRRFVSTVALGIASVPFISLSYGMTKGKHRYRLMREKIYFDDLPEAFDGFKLIHISDIHSGSFDDENHIREAISIINNTEADVLLFTGDLVNTHAREMDPWIDVFNAIKEFPMGKFGVLGNHDYGEYVTWNHPQDKIDNFNKVKSTFGKIGHKLLLNESVLLKKNNDSIRLIGVENWGVKFKQAGDLSKASEGIDKSDFKILMSHDPSHWELQVQSHPLHYHLTLSGHTHGMQFGIEIPGWIKWSPVQYVYKYWAGLYENAGRFLYVNRGFGYHAYPGRVGIWPEITLIELKKS